MRSRIATESILKQVNLDSYGSLENENFGRYLDFDWLVNVTKSELRSLETVRLDQNLNFNEFLIIDAGS